LMCTDNKQHSNPQLHCTTTAQIPTAADAHVVL
jgi:hypothetical protein